MLLLAHVTGSELPWSIVCVAMGVVVGYMAAQFKLPARNR